jgi:hypothetical protein
MRTAALGLVCVLAAACGEVTSAGPDDAGDSDGAMPAPPDLAPPPDFGPIPPCVPAEGSGPGTSNVLTDGALRAAVMISDRDTCRRGYELTTNAPLRDGQPGNPRRVPEVAGSPVVRTNNDLFDALYALALEEARQNAVDSIQDGAFNGGQPIACPPGGCFETGLKWKYVWTRDISYSVALSLGALHPTRARNSLEFKTSLRRSGGGRQIVQDTGTGGSYPVSTDRVVWALGAWELLKFLDGPERTAFRDLAYEAMVGTARHDRAVVYDAGDGLYFGEQSFLDWREQSYPDWTRGDVGHIGMSKALSTNVGHYVLLDVAARLAAEKGDAATQAELAGWATALRAAINARLWLPADGLYSTYLTTFLDRTPARRYDLLGESLAVLAGVADATQAQQIVAAYPQLPRGAPVIWPQQKETAIYHNRALWPFVSAFFLRAARQAKNDAAVEHNVQSLMRGAALNLSNMENLEMVTGAAWHDDGAFSGPAINSQRQLWSVAGYLSMVHDVVFGLDASQEGIRFSPYITRKMRRTLFAGADRIALSSFPYRGKEITVVVLLPKVDSDGGALAVSRVLLNGRDVGTGYLAPASLEARNLLVVELADEPAPAAAMRLVPSSAIADYKNLFAPRTPSVTGLSVVADRVQVAFDVAGEAAAEIGVRVFRDGAPVGGELAGSATFFRDDGSADHASRTHCYTVETFFLGSGNTSQRARPACWWGAGAARVRNIGAASFTNVGGNGSSNHGRFHYEGWGDDGHSLTIANVVPSFTGEHLLQVSFGNGAGPTSTGITCAVKRVEVREGANLVGAGHLVMAQAGDWAAWRDSSFVRVSLDKTKTYTITIVSSPQAVNMSVFDHFKHYGAAGGQSGPFNRVNIAELKLLALESL